MPLRLNELRSHPVARRTYGSKIPEPNVRPADRSLRTVLLNFNLRRPYIRLVAGATSGDVRHSERFGPDD